MIDLPIFEFKFKATPQDPTGYYFPRWDLAKDVTVNAANINDAKILAANLLGDNNRGWPWALKLKIATQIIT